MAPAKQTLASLQFSQLFRPPMSRCRFIFCIDHKIKKNQSLFPRGNWKVTAYQFIVTQAMVDHFNCFFSIGLQLSSTKEDEDQATASSFITFQ